VDEGAACSYSLSGGPEVAISPNGATGTVQVSVSSIDCPWTAVSSASWLTITAGASGTGPGSFTWSATPNTGTSDRSGTISVINQAITFEDGISVGTPGQGTVAIVGGPKEDVWNPCDQPPRPGNCPETIWESGTVSVSVGGVTAAAQYSGSTASAYTMASTIASALNYPLSPVSASASGSASDAVITITSTLNGSGTNYPLVVSETYGPTCSAGQVNGCFRTPAFLPTASGVNLAGAQTEL